MAKPPPNLPAKGDSVTLRGKEKLRVGVVISINPETNWTKVEWTDQGGPRLCHLFELEKLIFRPME